MLIFNLVFLFYLKGIENVFYFIIIDLKVFKKWNWFVFNGVNIKFIWIIWEVILNLVFFDNERECM